jgi:membrane-bound lytic murein transglycosylase D
MFSGDWWLSWASYNGGQGRVLGATRRAGTTDFWKIAAGDYLHTETENYVPKMIAAAIIGKHPERYGFVGVRYMPEWTFDAVEVPASTSVSVMAKCAGMTEDAFLALNPALRRFALPPEPAVQRVRITQGKTAAFKEAFAKVPAEERLTLRQHTVKRGESLGSIARKYGVSVQDLAKVNRIGNINQISVGMDLVVPMSAADVASVDGKSETKTEAKTETKTETKTEAKTEKPKTETKSVPATTHTVKSGDTLSGIASKYGTTVANLQAWNKLRGTSIQAGWKLVVKPAATTTVTSSTPPKTTGTSATPTSSTGKTTTYSVRRGDTLSSIADRYGCSVSDLKSWNGLKGSTIYVGQKLKIRS